MLALSPRVDIIVGDVLVELMFLPSDSHDCIVTSPPYWGLRDYGVEGQLGLEPTLEEYLSNLTVVFREARRVLKPGGTMWLVVGDSYARPAGKGQHKPGDAGKQNYIIERGGGRSANQNDHKSGNGFKRDARLTYSDKNGARGNEQQWTDVGGMRNARNVWTINSAPYKEAHFATFPPALVERCLKAGCPPRGRVLDPFGGAGTTGLVARRLGLNATLIELNPDYAALARARIDRDGA